MPDNTHIFNTEDSPTELLRLGVTELSFLGQETLFPCEWCMQFDNEEPVAFMSTTDESAPDKDNTITFTLKNSRYADLHFYANGREFKLFARPKTKNT